MLEKVPGELHAQPCSQVAGAAAVEDELGCVVHNLVVRMLQPRSPGLTTLAFQSIDPCVATAFLIIKPPSTRGPRAPSGRTQPSGEGTFLVSWLLLNIVLFVVLLVLLAVNGVIFFLQDKSKKNLVKCQRCSFKSPKSAECEEVGVEM